MSKYGETYTKEISPIYTNTPEIVEFKHQEYIFRKTWKIGNKTCHDMTRADFIKELENVEMSDVNQYKSNYLK